MWIKYEGDFQNSEKHGLGTLYLINGDKFFGNFEKDQAHGKGKYTKKGLEESLPGEEI